MADTIDQKIFDAIAARLAAIKKPDGYNTDAGLHVETDTEDFDEEQDSSSMLALSDPEEEFNDSLGDDQDVRVLSIDVTGHIKFGDDKPSAVARRLIADIKKAVLLPDDRRVGGLLMDDLRCVARKIELPEPGGKVVSVLVAFEAPFIETYGDPYAIATN